MTEGILAGFRLIEGSACSPPTATGEAYAAIESATGHDFETETGRYEGRDRIAAILRPWFAARTLAALRERFAGTGVSWGPYQTFHQLVDEDPRASLANPMFEPIDHPGVGLSEREIGGLHDRGVVAGPSAPT